MNDANILSMPQSVAVEVEVTLAKFFELHKNFAALLRKQNDALKTKQREVLAEIETQMGPMIEAYQADIRYLKHNAEIVKSFGDDIKTRLLAANAERAELTSKNIELLELAKKSGERVIRIIFDGVEDQKRKTSGTFYGNGGAIAPDPQVSRSFSFNSVV